MDEETNEEIASIRPRFARAGRSVPMGRVGFASKAGPVLSSAIGKIRQVAGAGAEWAEANPIAALAFAGTIAAVWIFARRRCVPSRGRFATAGVWADLARITGSQSDPPWVPSGGDLDVKTLQFYLNRLMNAGLQVDGVFGRKTAAAVRAFQEANGLYPSGGLDDETSGALEYLFHAASEDPRLKSFAAISPESAAQLGVTYAPYAMPQPIRYASYPMPRSYYPRSFSPQHRAGVQSISMSDPRHHFDTPAHFEDWGPGPDGGWW